MPIIVMNAVRLHEDWLSGAWWYPEVKSILAKYLGVGVTAPIRAIMSWMFGIGHDVAVQHLFKLR